MNFIKKHKFTTFVIIIFIVIIIVMNYLFGLFFINSGKPEYGNRLEGIENVELTKNDITNLQDLIKKNSNVQNVNINISGRTLDIVIHVSDKLSLKDAKKIGNISLEGLSDKQIDYYSVQVFIKKDSKEQNNFPIIGYKQRGTKVLVWSKDREVTNADENK